MDNMSRWWTSETLAVVTGANKGIGFEIVRQLAENGLTVVLTARDMNRGMEATKCLQDQGLNRVLFHQLDIQSPHSVSAFVNWLKETFGGLDILVNNAGINGLKVDLDAGKDILQSVQSSDLVSNPSYSSLFTTTPESMRECIETNYYGTKRLTEELLPLFRPGVAGCRIVNVSSEAGLLKLLRNESFRQELSDKSKLSEELIDEMVERFLMDVRSGQVEEKGWQPNFPHYSFSKLALNCYTRLLADKFSNNKEKMMYVNSVHPGWVQTDMGSNTGDLTPSQGAESCVMIALFPPGGPSGQFFYKKQTHPF